MIPTTIPTSGDPTGGSWLDDRRPLLPRVTGRYRAVWALLAAGLSDQELAARLHLPLVTVRRAVVSVYRALALDPADRACARVDATQLYLVAVRESGPEAARDGPPGT